VLGGATKELIKVGLSVLIVAVLFLAWAWLLGALSGLLFPGVDANATPLPLLTFIVYVAACAYCVGLLWNSPEARARASMLRDLAEWGCEPPSPDLPYTILYGYWRSHRPPTPEPKPTYTPPADPGVWTQEMKSSSKYAIVIAILFVLLVMVFRACGSTPTNCISWTQAAAHIGESTCVSGVVYKTAVDPKSGAFFIDFDNSYTSFYGVSFQWVWDGLTGQCIELYGTISTYNGRPQMVIESKDKLSGCRR
jgi:uncharacterized RDD family membrane protein YckC